MPPSTRILWFFAGLALFAVEPMPTPTELKVRFPRARTAYSQFRVVYDEAAPGFFKPVSEHTVTHAYAYEILKGEAAGSRVVHCPITWNQKLEGWVSWVLPDGKTEKVSLDKFQVRSVGVEKNYEFRLPALPEGTRVEEHYTAVIDGNLQGKAFLLLPKDAYLHACHLEFVIPKNREYKVKNLQPGEGGGVLQEKDHPSERRRIITLDLSGLGPKDPEPLAPLAVPPVALMWDIEAPPTLLYTPTQIFRNVHANMASRRPWFSPAVENTVQRILQGKTSPREKVESICTFLQNEIKVLKAGRETGGGLFGNSRLDFADMLERKEGSPEGIVALMQQMLEKEGIPSKVVIIHEAFSGPFDPAFFDTREDYSFAVWVDLDGTPVLASPQEAGRPLGDLNRTQMNRPAVVIRSADTLEILRTPASMPVENRYEDTWNLELDDRGNGKLHFERRATGPEARETRSVWKAMPSFKQSSAEAIWKILPASPFGEPLKGSVQNAENPEKPLLVSLDLSLPRICRVRDGLIEVAPWATAFALGLADTAPLPDTPRRDPLWVPYDQVIRRTLMVKAPSTWELQTPLPAAVEVKNGLGTATAAYALEGNALKVDQFLSLRNGLRPAGEARDLIPLAGPKSPLVMPLLQFKLPSAPGKAK